MKTRIHKGASAVKFYTLGCKVNQYETQSIVENFLRHGFKKASGKTKADICLINTCTVTSSADRKSRNFINRAIRDNPKAKVIVTGCLVKKDSEALLRLKGIALIAEKSFFPDGLTGFSNRSRAFLKIQDGCDNFCSYCKVPLVRGRSKSRRPDDIVKEAEALVKNGYKEIVITGVCLGAYGKDLCPQVSLAVLIKSLENIQGLLRIRLSSIEAEDVTPELINLMKKSGKLCHHLHLPLQSGDNEILKGMNRKYFREDYLNLVNTLKKQVPDIAITTDVIVGFPGETELNFRNTMALLKGILPLKVHIFPYSGRKGTAAFRHKDEVSREITAERVCRLKKLSDKLSLEFRRRFLNKTLNVLIEGKSKKSSELWEGYSDNYIHVFSSSNSNLKNKIVSARLESIKEDYNLAELLH